MSQTDGPTDGEHQHGPEDSRPENIGQAEITLFESRVRNLMRHPKVEDFKLPSEIPAAFDPDEFGEEPEDLDTAPRWTTQYRKDGAIIDLIIVEPGNEPKDYDQPITVSITRLLSVTDIGHRFLRDENYIVLNQGDTLYEQETIEVDAQGYRVRTSREEDEIAASKRNDPSLLINRVAEETQAGLRGPISKDKFNELMGLLDSLTPEDEVQS